MIATDLLLDRILQPEELTRGIERALGCRAATVRVIDDVQELLQDPLAPGTCLIVERNLRDGGFPLHLSLTPTGGQGKPPSLETVQRLCREWVCACLLPDGTPNASGWVLVTAERVAPAAFDPEAKLIV